MSELKLTPLQMDQLEIYRNNGIAKAISTEPLNMETVNSFVEWLYATLGLAKPTIIIMPNPLHAHLAMCYIAALEPGIDRIRDQIYLRIKRMADSLNVDILGQIRDQRGYDLYIDIHQYLIDDVSYYVDIHKYIKTVFINSKLVDTDSLCLSVLLERVITHIDIQTGGDISADVDILPYSMIYPYIIGQSRVLDFHLFHYISDVMNIHLSEDYLHYATSVDLGLVYPLDGFCIVSERLTGIHFKDGLLHKDEGPALSYKDNFHIWALNGVRVPKWLAERRVEDIDCAEFAKIKNVEIRREFVRKVGIERICSQLGSTILGKVGDMYELHLIDLGGSVGSWPYLKMRNPSIGVWHFEAVPRDIKTVEEAINWRNQSELHPTQLT